jgi:hypothetical protein
MKNASPTVSKLTPHVLWHRDERLKTAAYTGRRRDIFTDTKAHPAKFKQNRFHIHFSSLILVRRNQLHQLSPTIRVRSLDAFLYRLINTDRQTITGLIKPLKFSNIKNWIHANHTVYDSNFTDRQTITGLIKPHHSQIYQNIGFTQTILYMIQISLWFKQTNSSLLKQDEAYKRKQTKPIIDNIFSVQVHCFG